MLRAAIHLLAGEKENMKSLRLMLRPNLQSVRLGVAAICLALLASCASEPDGSRARPTGGPSLQECLEANGIYFVQLAQANDGDHLIVQEVWRHDAILGERPAIGSELLRPGRPHAIGGTRIPDHFVVFKFMPPLERPGHGGTSMSQSSVFDGYVPVFDLSLSSLRRLIQKTPHVAAEPIQLHPVGDENWPVVHRGPLPASAPGHTSPHLIHSVPPVYPRELREQRITGEAMIDLLVTADGEVKDVKVVRATDVRFGDAAAAAVRQWTYAPAQRDGQPVETRMQVPIVFTLRDR